MATCEKCGATFVVSSKPVEVTSARILCAECEAEHRAAKLARAAGAPASSAKSGVNSTAHPAATKRASVDGAVRRNDAPPVAKALQATRSVPAPAAKSEPPSTPSRPAAKPTPPPAAKAPPRQSTSLREAYAKQGLPKTTKVGLLVLGILVVIAAGVIFVVKSKKDADAKVVAEHKAKVDAFLSSLRTKNLETVDGCKAAIAEIAANPDLIEKESAVANEVGSIEAKAKASMQSIEERGHLTSLFNDLQTKLANPEALQSEELAELRRRIEELQPNAGVMGADFIAELGKFHARVDQLYVPKLHDEAKAFAEANADKGRVALGKFAAAEDEIAKLLEKSMKDRNKDLEAIYKQHYQDIIVEADKLCAAVFTPDVIEKTPWRDLLVPDAGWIGSPVQGFSFRVENGALLVVGPDPEAGRQAILSVGDKEQWRDFVLDMEFTIEKGTVDVFFRLGKQANATVESTALTTAEGGLTAGQTYSAEATLIGSKLVFKIHSDEFPAYEPDLTWGKSRKGGFGLVVPENTAFKFTRLKIRELR